MPNVQRMRPGKNPKTKAKPRAGESSERVESGAKSAANMFNRQAENHV